MVCRTACGMLLRRCLAWWRATMPAHSASASASAKRTSMRCCPSGPELLADLTWWLPNQREARARHVDPPLIPARGVRPDLRAQRCVSVRPRGVLSRSDVGATDAWKRRYLVAQPLARVGDLFWTDGETAQMPRSCLGRVQARRWDGQASAIDHASGIFLYLSVLFCEW
jgi:hypothetical protein